MSFTTVTELWSPLDNPHQNMINWGWTLKSNGDINEGRHNMKWKFGCVDKCVDIGRYQSFYIKNATRDAGDQTVMSDIMLKPDGQCPVGYIANGGERLNHSTDDYGCGYKRVCYTMQPLVDSSKYVNDVYIQKGLCSGGYTDLGRIHDCNRGPDTRLCAKIIPVNYLRDHYCLETKGVNLEHQICRDRFKRENKALFDDRIKKFCLTNRGERFGAKGGVCRYEAENDNTGRFDDIVGQYCADHPTDSYCGCTFSYISRKYQFSPDENAIINETLKANPQCFTSECGSSEGSYRFKAQKDGWLRACPAIQQCNIKIQNVQNSEIKNVRCEQTLIMQQQKEDAAKAAEEAKRQAALEQARQILAQRQSEEAAKQAAAAAASKAAADKAAADKTAANKAAADEKARLDAIARAKAEQDRIIAEKKAKQFLPLPSALRVITDKWDVPDTVLTAGLLGIIVILIFGLGLFSDEEEFEMPYQDNMQGMPYQENMQGMPYQENMQGMTYQENMQGMPIQY
jgi:hypothetical protein